MGSTKSVQLRLTCTYFILVSLMVVGCGSLGERNRLSAFDYQTHAYGRMLRWGDFAQAAAMRRAKVGNLSPTNLNDYREIRVTSYQIQRSKLSTDRSEAVLDAVIDYYHERYNQVRTLSDQQTWWYDEENQKWFLDSNLPKFSH